MKWAHTQGARNLLGAATPEFKPVKKPRYTKTGNCDSCGWHKSVGHDRWCKYVGRENG